MSVAQVAEQLLMQAPGRRRPGRPILWHLGLFGVGILVPVLLFTAIVAIHFASIEQARYRHDARRHRLAAAQRCCRPRQRLHGLR